MRLLSIPGRKSGRTRTTPVSPLTVAGQRYVVAVFDDTDWVKTPEPPDGESWSAAASASG